MNRRRGSRFNRGRIPARPSGQVVTPITIIQSFGSTSTPETLGTIVIAQSFTGSATPSYAGAMPLDPINLHVPSATHYYIGDLGISEVDAAGRTSAWADQVSVSPANRTQATAANQPSHTSVAGLNNMVAVSGNGADRWLINGPDYAAPGTTPIAQMLVMRVNAWVSQGRVLTTGLRLGTTAGTSSTRSARLNNGTAGPEITNIVEGTWYLVILCMQNTTGDYLTFGADTNTVTGTNVGNTNPTAEAMFAAAAGTTPSNVSIAMQLTKPSDFTSGEKSSMRAWIANYYGGGVVV